MVSVTDGPAGLRLDRVEGNAIGLIGAPAAALVGAAGPFIALIDEPADRDAVRDGLSRVLSHVHRFERLIWLRGRPLRLAAQGGPPVEGAASAVMVLTDASAEAAERAERAQAESRFRKAFMAAPGLFAISNPTDGRHVDVNDLWLKVMGWRREEVIGRTAAELGVWADPQDRARLVATLASNGSVRDFETRFRTRGGDVREFLVTGEMIELDGARRLLLVAHDMTERNQAVRALAALNEELERRVERRTAALSAEARRRQDAEGRLRATLDGVADAVVTADARGRILSFNPAAERLFGLSAAEAVGGSITRLMPEPYATHHDGYIRDFLARRDGDILGGGRELPARRADGTVLPVEVALSHLTLDGEHLFTAVIRDVSERKEHEAQMRAAKEAAEEANRAKSSFLSSMSHELRTPMNAILGFAQLMRVIEPETLTPRNDEYIGHILSAGNHLLSLIDDVLDLSKIEAGRITLSLEPVALDDLLAHVTALLRPMADRFAVTIRYAPAAAAGLRVWADSVRLGQVLINLGSNAAKYNRPGGWMDFSCRMAEDRPGFVRLVVSDNGQGIPTHRLPEVFQPFNRLGAEGGPIEGTGIGLSIARQLVEMMGGSIGVDSAPGRGATFTLDLPAAEGTAQGSSRVVGTRVPEPAALEALSARPWTILYIDDVSSNVRLMAGVLSRYPNIRLLSAPTAENGLELAQVHRPDLVVMDINLPGVDGFQLLHQMRGMPDLAGIPAIALTARTTPREQDRGLRAGFAAYLAKPLDVGRLLVAADAALGREMTLRTPPPEPVPSG
ncbi:hybrid sensor histidine kinase/response regulator [Novispirillum sp. DQ9]|uniref:hybrid sensor histidine kinase/response regulator n=1 Tax=Novispirillum sp. DQ9 TaxID=3398612 RepID=UPI003C7D9FD2